MVNALILKRFMLLLFGIHFPAITEISDSKYLNPTPETLKTDLKIAATGFQYDSGAAWSILCLETPYGEVPGKLDNAGGAYYPWGGKEHKCEKYKAISGKLVHNTDELPKDCEPQGFQTNDDAEYYNAVVSSEDGMVPGKAKEDLSYAWYSYGGVEKWVTDEFYVVC